jgi:hypothetical protein
MTFAQQVLAFYQQLQFTVPMPPGVQALLPFEASNAHVTRIMQQFYHRFYNDTRERTMIIGINPGRLGAGATGIPFTDTVRLQQDCGIEPPPFKTHEPSSVFVYRVIQAFGGPEAFYRRFYITSICPVGFVKHGTGGKPVNWNYYDDPAFAQALTPFIIAQMEKQLDMGINRHKAIVFGTGKNFRFIDALNRSCKWFGVLEPLEHPRYIMQYKARQTDEYVHRYLLALAG